MPKAFFLAFLFVCHFFASHASALDLEEAISLALANSDKIKEQDFQNLKAKTNLKSTYSNFAPKANLAYSSTQSTRANGDIFTTNLTEASASYNIFNGLQDFHAVRKYKHLKSAQEHILEATKQDIVLLAKTLYIDILQARDTLAISQESIRLLELQRQQANDFYTQGVRAKSDLLSVEVMLENSKITLSSNQNALTYSLLQLKKLIQKDVSADSVQSLEMLDLENLQIERAKLADAMLENRSEYLYLREIIAAAKQDVQIAKGTFLPSVNASVSRLWYSNDVSTLNRLGTNLQSRAQITASWNLFNGFGDYFKIQSARYETLSLESTLSELKKTLFLSLDEALSDLSMAREQYAIAQNAVQLGEENYRIVQNRYKQNIETSRELLNAEVALSQARLYLNQSQHRIYLALARLERIVQKPLHKI